MNLSRTTGFSSVAGFIESSTVVWIRMDNLMTTGSSEADDAWLHLVLSRIRWTFLPIVVAGTFTNCFNFVVLSHKDMRSCSTSVYLTALAVADLGVMYFELFRVWFEWAQLVRPEAYFTDAYCKIVNYTNGVARDYSNWLVACLTLERVIRIADPYCAREFCTLRRARIVTLFLLLAICIPHVHSLFFSTALKKTGWVCWEDPKSRVGWILAGLVEFVVGYVVVLVVFVLNMILILMIYRNRMPRSNASAVAAALRVSTAALPSSSPLPSVSRAVHSSAGSRHRRTNNRRLTRTLLVVAIVFLFCETPRMISSVVCKFLERTPLRRIILNLSFVLSGINHSANFFIYIVSSPRFRQLLMESVRKTCRRTADGGRNNPPRTRLPLACGRGISALPLPALLQDERGNVNGGSDIYVGLQINVQVIVNSSSSI